MHTKTEVIKLNLNSRTSRRGIINYFTRSWNWRKAMAWIVVECLRVCTLGSGHFALRLECVVTFILYPD